MSTPADIVISEFMDEASVEALGRHYQVHYDAELVDKPAALADALTNARGLIVRNRTRVETALLDSAPSLEVVGRLGVGLDNIDLDACRSRGIEVCPATGANDIAVAEHVITCAMVLLRRAYFATDAVRAGNWPRQACVGHEIHGKRLGLVGFGGIAREVTKRAIALGMTVSAFDPHLPPDDDDWALVQRVDTLDRLLTSVDVLSLHVPLTDATHNMIDATSIAKLNSGVVIINTARGGVVNESAVVDALIEGRLSGAALDVFSHEPVDSTSGARFPDLENLILTPHIAGVTIESNVRVSAVTARNVQRVLERKA